MFCQSQSASNLSTAFNCSFLHSTLLVLPIAKDESQKIWKKKRYIYVHLCWKHFWPLPLTLYILPFQMILWSSSWFSFPFTVIGLEVAVSDWRHAMWRQSDNNSRDNNYFACTVARPRTCRILMKGQRLNHNHMHASLWLCPLCLFFVK